MAEPSFPPGIHVPALTFFHDDTRQDIDWETQEKHLDFLIRSGLHGIVTAGTNGEAISLTTDEKCELIRRTKAIAAKAGRLDLPVTAGCSAGCTRDVIDLTIKSKEAGADFALILVSSFFHFALDESAIVSFFQNVADASPLPIVLYNFPGVVAGLDINSDMVDILGRHPNIVAAKFTCGSVAKLTRVAASFLPSQCTALAGQMEWLVPALVVGGQGAIAGFANLFPRICVELFNLQRSGKADEARKLQQKVAVADLGMGKGGINGTKWVVCKLLGYPDSSTVCRKPYPLFTEEKKQEMIIAKMRPLEGIEANLGRHSELSNGTAVKVVLG